MIAPHDVSAAVDELARNVERGFKAAFLVPVLSTTVRGTIPSMTHSGAKPSGSGCLSASTEGARPT